MNERLPLRFFVISFLWSWLIWLPLVLAGLGVLRLAFMFFSKRAFKALSSSSRCSGEAASSICSKFIPYPSILSLSSINTYFL